MDAGVASHIGTGVSASAHCAGPLWVAALSFEWPLRDPCDHASNSLRGIVDRDVQIVVNGVRNEDAAAKSRNDAAALIFAAARSVHIS
jgi:hypothetical protein